MNRASGDNRSMEPLAVTIAMKDTSRGYEMSPERVPLAALTGFAKDVQDFIRGPGKEVDPAAVEVSVQHGSLAIHAGNLYSDSLLADLSALAMGQDLSKVSRKRREVVRKWQEQASRVKQFAVRIASPKIPQAIVVSESTDFRERASPRLVTVERYIRGEIQDLGGVTDSNAHIKLPDGQKLTIRTDRELIRAESRNLVYREVYLRIRAKLNMDTGKLSDPELISFVDYEPRFDADKFAQAVQRGREAWRDAGDPAAWVRSIRGED